MKKKELQEKLKFMRLNGWAEEWNAYMKMSTDDPGMSFESLLTHMIEKEFERKQSNALKTRIKRAKIEDLWSLDTYPFKRQPKLDQRHLMGIYEGFEYIKGPRNIVWIGPTGCGKTAIATSFLLQALEQGRSGMLITFSDLTHLLFQAAADYSEIEVVEKFVKYDNLLIDEVGYIEIESAQVGLFFEIMHKRHKKSSTFITSNLGFSEWGKFLKNDHLSAALIDRLTENCEVFNMSFCKSLRGSLDKNK